MILLGIEKAKVLADPQPSDDNQHIGQSTDTMLEILVNTVFTEPM